MESLPCTLPRIPSTWATLFCGFPTQAIITSWTYMALSAVLSTTFQNNFDHPTPHMSKKYAPKICHKWGVVWRKIPWNKRTLTENMVHEPTFMAYKLQLLWRTNPDFSAIWTVFIGGGGGLEYIEHWDAWSLWSSQLLRIEDALLVYEFHCAQLHSTQGVASPRPLLPLLQYCSWQCH